LHRIVRDYERKFWYLWKENTDLRELSLELQNQIAKTESATTATSGGGILSWLSKIFH
jgi:hypothetical protein